MLNNLEYLELISIPLIGAEAQSVAFIDEMLIDTVITKARIMMQAHHPITDREFALLKARLTTRYRVSMDLGVAVSHDHVPWLRTWRLANPGADNFYWRRYRKFLDKKLGGGVVQKFDTTTDSIVDLFGNPTLTAPFQRRGLVIGDVQSGKTSTYIGLCTKAADVGYRLIILLTGTIEILRRQSQKRLDEGFVGKKTSRDTITQGGSRAELLGVGLIDPQKFPQFLTTRDLDFSRNLATQAGIQLEANSIPTLLVTKKNSNNLENIVNWVTTLVPNNGKLDSPLLVIDDESDNASVNYLDDNAPTGINAKIRKLLSKFNHATYVGVTATPFANVFIKHDSVHEMLGDDLFPRDFIYALSSPSNYSGVRELFTPTETDLGNHQHLRFEDNENADAWLPLKHKVDYKIDGLPESLCEAVLFFLLSTAIRDIRDRDLQISETEWNRSMLVNVTRFTGIQSDIRSHIEKFLNSVKSDIQAYSLTRQFENTDCGPKLKRLFDQLSKHHVEIHSTLLMPDWNTVKKTIHSSIEPIQTIEVNQRSGVSQLDFSGGKRLIVVGGNSLSRGITLEGLNVTYFHRKPGAKDTLMQMGRWFGYRDGYLDLCRIYMTNEARADFFDASETLDDLQSEIERMSLIGLTPKDFGLRVLHHPGALTIAARNKMRSVGQHTVRLSVSGQHIETARLPIQHNESNLNATEIFVRNLGAPSVENTTQSGPLIWNSVPRESIADFLKNFKFHYQIHGFFPTGDQTEGPTVTFIRNGEPKGSESNPLASLKTWDVALLQGENDPYEFAGNSIKLRKRVAAYSEDEKTLLVSGQHVRLGSKLDEAIGLSNEALKEINQKRATGKKASGRDYRERRSLEIGRPLLLINVIHPVWPTTESVPAIETRPKLPNAMVAIGMSFPFFNDLEEVGTVEYRINTVAIEQLGIADESDDDSEDQLDAI